VRRRDLDHESEAQNDESRALCPVAELPWRTRTQRLSEDETQIECADVGSVNSFV
jgi:hypothetical protein